MRPACGRCRSTALTVEVTENALMVDRERSHRVLTELREIGVRISIDDFGTGYSSLSYLKQMPADELKIDKSFVMNMLADEADARIVEQVVALGHAFGLEVVAEGVESAGGRGEARRHGLRLRAGLPLREAAGAAGLPGLGAGVASPPLKGTEPIFQGKGPSPFSVVVVGVEAPELVLLGGRLRLSRPRPSPSGFTTFRGSAC